MTLRAWWMLSLSQIMTITGAAGNVAAGKYNDGSKENRPVLTRRIYDAIVAADVLYSDVIHPHLRRIFEANLAPGGTVLLADPFRKMSGLLSFLPLLLITRAPCIDDRGRYL